MRYFGIEVGSMENVYPIELILALLGASCLAHFSQFWCGQASGSGEINEAQE